MDIEDLEIMAQGWLEETFYQADDMLPETHTKLTTLLRMVYERGVADGANSVEAGQT